MKLSHILLLLGVTCSYVAPLPKPQDFPTGEGQSNSTYLTRNSTKWNTCPTSDVFYGMEAGVSGYDLLKGDIYHDFYDPGFKSQIFKVYRKNEYGCFVSERGITVRPIKSCSSRMSSYTYDSFESYIEQSQDVSSSSSDFQLGLKKTVKAEIPNTGVGIETTIPPTFTAGFGNSASSSKMSGFFESESGYGVTSHTECNLFHMTVSDLIAPPFAENFNLAIGFLYKATKKSAATQRNGFLIFLNTYGTHFFTEVVYGAKVSLTQRFSEHTIKEVGQETARKCTQSKASFRWLAKAEKSSCSDTAMNTLEDHGGSTYEQIITTRGSEPPRDGQDWFDQDFVPVPLKYQVSPIVNLFTDAIFGSQDITTSDGEQVSAKALREVFAPLYYNYCGPDCECFIANCKTCSASGETCEICHTGFFRIGNGQSCTVTRTIYIIEYSRTETFSMNGQDGLHHLDSHTHSSSLGCNYCAYSTYNEMIYLSGRGFPPYTQTSSFYPPNNHVSEKSLTKGSHSAFSFIINNRIYVAGGYNGGHLNTVHSKQLTGSSSWRKEINLPGTMCWTSRSGVVFNNHVYSTGGEYNGVRSNKVWRWSPGAAQWTAVTSMIYTHRYHCSVLVNNKFIFVLGGSSSGSNSIEYFDIENQKWSLKQSSPYSSSYPSCAAVNSDIYVHYSKSIYKYNTEQDIWTLLYTMGTASTFATAMLIV